MILDLIVVEVWGFVILNEIVFDVLSWNKLMVMGVEVWVDLCG